MKAVASTPQLFGVLAKLAATLRASGTSPALDVTAVFNTEGAFVWATLQRLGVREADRDDVFQEIFVVVHQRLHTYDATQHGEQASKGGTLVPPPCDWGGDRLYRATPCSVVPGRCGHTMDGDHCRVDEVIAQRRVTP